MLQKRDSKTIESEIGSNGVEFFSHVKKSIEGILPHVETVDWKLHKTLQPSNAVWSSNKRKQITISISFGNKTKGYTVNCTVQRKRLINIGETTLDTREHHICKCIAERASEILNEKFYGASDFSISVSKNSFDEHVIARHIETHNGFSNISIQSIFDAIHTLSEQSYENKALTFGCILDPAAVNGDARCPFPKEFLKKKKYKALSDGYRTVYEIASNGEVSNFLDLKNIRNKTSAKNYYPSWAKDIACASRKGKCGLVLSRQGDILIFDEGTLRFTYRYGSWQYWNHSYIIELLKNRARVQHVAKENLGKVISSIYRASLDVSFRRSGGLFVLLRNQKYLKNIVRLNDIMAQNGRSIDDRIFDAIIQRSKIQSLSQSILVELAALDGAVVLRNSGEILAYGAVLQPKKTGKLKGTEGSRTKAATGASNYGLAVKISSDGGIAVYDDGKIFIEI